MPETKDDVVIHLQRIFSFVDWYVDNCRHEREEEGVSDEYLNIRAKFLQLIPDTFSGVSVCLEPLGLFNEIYPDDNSRRPDVISFFKWEN